MVIQDLEFFGFGKKFAEMAQFYVYWRIFHIQQNILGVSPDTVRVNAVSIFSVHVKILLAY
jgi:hypothetical protein